MQKKKKNSCSVPSHLSQWARFTYGWKNRNFVFVETGESNESCRFRTRREFIKFLFFFFSLNQSWMQALLSRKNNCSTIRRSSNDCGLRVKKNDNKHFFFFIPSRVLLNNSLSLPDHDCFLFLNRRRFVHEVP